MPRIDFDKFDPNSLDQPMYGLWNGFQFIAKDKRGGLLTKFGNDIEAKLYILEPEGWRLLAHKCVVKGARACDQCGAIIKHSVNWRYSSATSTDSNLGRWEFVRNASNKVVEPLELRYVGSQCCDWKAR